MSHAQRIFDITTKRYRVKPHVSQTFYIVTCLDLTWPDLAWPDLTWLYTKSYRAVLFQNEVKIGSKRKDQDKKNKHTNLAPAVQQATQTLQYTPVQSFPAPLHLVCFSCKSVWNNMQAYIYM